MTALGLTVLLCAAAAGGCICVCAATEFETACLERGGRVRSLAATRRKACVAADAGVIATWVDDDAGKDDR